MDDDAVTLGMWVLIILYQQVYSTTMGSTMSVVVNNLVMEGIRP